MRLLVTGGRTSAYGEAKVEAEQAALASSPDVVVARTSLVLGDGESKHEQLFRSLALGGADATSRLELGRLVARRDGLDPSALRAGRRADLPDPGPVDVRLDSGLAATLLRTRLRGAREFLAS